MRKKMNPLVVIVLSLCAITLLVSNLTRYMARKESAPTAANLQQSTDTQPNLDIASTQQMAEDSSSSATTINIDTDGGIEDSLPQHIQAAYPAQQPTPKTEATFDSETALPGEQPTIQPVATRTISVTNETLDKKLAYKFMMISYSPEEFSIIANGVKIDQDEMKPVPVGHNNKLDVTYYARFKNGRESSQTYSFNLAPQTTALNVSFDWHHDPRIVIDDSQATYLGKEVVK